MSPKLFSKKPTKKQLLVQTLLASSIFVAPLVYADLRGIHLSDEINEVTIGSNTIRTSKSTKDDPHSNAANVFILENGSTIKGNIIGSKKANIYELRGGVLTEGVIGGIEGDIFNQYTGEIPTYQGNAADNKTDTFKIMGGTFGILKTSSHGTTTVDLSPITKAYNVGEIEGNNSLLFINVGKDVANTTIVAAKNISGLSRDLTVFKDNIFVPNTTIATRDVGSIINNGTIQIADQKGLFDFSKGSGAFSNAGTINIEKEGVLKIKGGTAKNIFTHTKDAIIQIEINGNKNGYIAIDQKNVALSKNAIIRPNVTGKLTTDTFDIIKIAATVGVITDSSTLDVSLVPTDIHFRKKRSGKNILQLIIAGSDCIVDTPGEVDHLISSKCLNNKIWVTNAGTIENNPGESEVLLLDDKLGGYVTIDPENNVESKKTVLSTGNVATKGIYMTGRNNQVTIGKGSGVTAESTKDDSHAIAVAGTQASIINEGTIQLNGTNAIKANAIYVDTNGSVTVNNKEGSVISNSNIYTTSAIAVGAGASLTLDNRGSILNKSDLNATIYADNAQLMDIVNQGSIRNKKLNATAINLSAALQGTFIQRANQVTGHVLLAQSDSKGGKNVFTLEGGTIKGEVRGASANANIYELKGGEITEKLIGGSKGDAFNQSDGKINIYQGNAAPGKTDLFKITGGRFTILNTSINGTTEVNISPATDYTMGKIDGRNSLLTINIGKGVRNTTITAGQDITGLSGDLTIFKDNTFVPHAIISSDKGHIINNGVIKVANDNGVFDFSKGAGIFNNKATLELKKEGVLTLNSGIADNVFTMAKDSIIHVEINGNENGAITIDQKNVVLAKDSIVIPKVIGALPAKDKVYDIITVLANGTITDDSTLRLNEARGIKFEKILNHDRNILQLKVLDFDPSNKRLLYRPQSSTQVTPGIGDTLDAINEKDHTSSDFSNDFETFFGQGDQLFFSQMAVEEMMQSLAPPYNYGLVQGTKQGMDETFNAVSDRLSDVSWRLPHAYSQHQNKKRHKPRQPDRPLIKTHGINYGDDTDQDKIWLRVLSAYTNQGSQIPGYVAKGAGLALGADFKYNDCNMLGLAVNYYKANVDDKHVAPKDEAIRSWQGTLYGYFDFKQGVFLDLMVAGSRNDYKLNRAIVVNTLFTTAQASFNGTLWGAQTDLGIVIPGTNRYFLAPYMRAKYLHLVLDSYRETGAGDLGLSVNNSDIDEFMGGVGFKLSTLWEADNVGYVPELSALIGYDFIHDGESGIANFIGDGPAFSMNGVKPAPILFDLGIGLSVIADKNRLLTIKYDLEARDNFYANAAYVQYAYQWS